jgi:hypothetical protein
MVDNVADSNCMNNLSVKPKTSKHRMNRDPVFYHYICPSGGSSVHPVFYLYICPSGGSFVHPGFTSTWTDVMVKHRMNRATSTWTDVMVKHSMNRATSTWTDVMVKHRMNRVTSTWTNLQLFISSLQSCIHSLLTDWCRLSKQLQICCKTTITHSLKAQSVINYITVYIFNIILFKVM